MFRSDSNISMLTHPARAVGRLTIKTFGVIPTSKRAGILQVSLDTQHTHAYNTLSGPVVSRHRHR